MIGDLRPFLPTGVSAQIWRRRDRRRFEAAPNRHAELVVLVALSGRMNYYLDGQMLQVTPQSVLFAYPGQAHFLVSETSNFDMYVGVVSSVLLRPSPTHPPVEPNTVGSDASGRDAALKRLPRSGLTEIAALADQLITATDQGAVDVGVAWWLHRTWMLSSRPTALDEAMLHPKVAAAIELIYADPGIAVGAVAEKVAMTATRLGQLFRREVGMTMSAFRTERRFELFDNDRTLNPKKTLLAAALDAGFADYPSFFRAHRARHGTAPRRALRQGEKDPRL